MKKALLKLLALSLALTFVMGVLSGCGDTAEKDSDGDVVKIGFVTYLAGDQAYVGQAAKLALEDYVTGQAYNLRLFEGSCYRGCKCNEQAYPARWCYCNSWSQW